MLSFVAETRILGLRSTEGDVEMDEEPIPGFDLNTQTRYCSNVFFGQFLQVTDSHVRLIRPDGQTVTWAPTEGSISMAASNCCEVRLLSSIGL